MSRREKIACEQATGCAGSGGFRQWAQQHGYPYCEVFDWTSSAGDWSFVVSKNGNEWFIMSQENNYPRGGGYTRTVDESQPRYGTAEEVMREIADECDAR